MTRYEKALQAKMTPFDKAIYNIAKRQQQERVAERRAYAHPKRQAERIWQAKLKRWGRKLGGEVDDSVIELILSEFEPPLKRFIPPVSKTNPRGLPRIPGVGIKWKYEIPAGPVRRSAQAAARTAPREHWPERDAFFSEANRIKRLEKDYVAAKAEIYRLELILAKHNIEY